MSKKNKNAVETDEVAVVAKTSVLYNLLSFLIAIVAFLVLAYSVFAFLFQGITVFGGMFFNYTVIFPVINSFIGAIQNSFSSGADVGIIVSAFMMVIAAIFLVITLMNLILCVFKLLGFLKFKESFENRKYRFVGFMKRALYGLGFMVQLILFSLFSTSGVLKTGKLILIAACVLYGLVVLIQALFNIKYKENASVLDEIFECIRRAFFLLIPIAIAYAVLKPSFFNLQNIVFNSATDGEAELLFGILPANMLLSIVQFITELILSIIVLVSVRKAFRLGFAEREFTRKRRMGKNYNAGLATRAIFLCIFLTAYLYVAKAVVPAQELLPDGGISAVLTAIKTDYLWAYLLILAELLITMFAGSKALKPKAKAVKEEAGAETAEETEVYADETEAEETDEAAEAEATDEVEEAVDEAEEVEEGLDDEIVEEEKTDATEE